MDDRLKNTGRNGDALPFATEQQTPFGSRPGFRRVFVRDYETRALIGVYDSEQNRHQRIRLSIDLMVSESSEELQDKLDNVVCYDTLVQQTEAHLAKGHIGLVETLAEDIAELALQDRRVACAKITVEKLEAIKGAASVGVEIERRQAWFG